MSDAHGRPRVLSADAHISHIVEPPDLFVERIEPKDRDREKMLSGNAARIYGW